MKASEVLERYVQLCVQGLEETPRVQTLLRNQGIRESFLFHSFRIGYSTGSLLDVSFRQGCGTSHELGSEAICDEALG